jgi:RES domain-containing protein
MLVYRIVLEKYADALAASGNPARWNTRDVKMIYTTGSRALACLENVVHRGSRGLQNRFRILVIEVPAQLSIAEIHLRELRPGWEKYQNYPFTQNLGENWIRAGKTAILRVPSVIIPEESNYLINPLHHDFAQIKLKSSQSFVFDKRIKSKNQIKGKTIGNN